MGVLDRVGERLAKSGEEMGEIIGVDAAGMRELRYTLADDARQMRMRRNPKIQDSFRS